MHRIWIIALVFNLFAGIADAQVPNTPLSTAIDSAPVATVPAPGDNILVIQGSSPRLMKKLDGASYFTGSVDLITDLRNYTGAVGAASDAANTGSVMIVRGGTVLNDGNGGVYYWLSTASATDDGFNVIKPTAVVGNGRWVRVNTQQFGTVLNNDALKNACTSNTSCPVGSPIFPNGVWRVDFANGLGAGPLFFSPSGSACALNSGNGNGASEVKSANNTCWNGKLGPRVAVAQFGAAGSSPTTTGNITAAGAALTIANPQDFANGEGVFVCGAGANQTASPVVTASAVQHGTVGSTTYNYKFISDDGKGGLATPLLVTITNGNATLSPTNYVALTWTIPSGSVSTHVFVQQGAGAWRYIGNTANNYYNDLSYSVPLPLWVPATPLLAAQNDGLTTTISSGGGTTALTLANNATNSVTGGCVLHEDHAAIQAAWDFITNEGAIFYPGGSAFFSFHTPNLMFGNNAWYNVAVGITSTIAGAIGWSSDGGSIINALGYSLTTLTETGADRLELGNLTFTGGAHALSLSNANVDSTRYVLRNVRFVGINDYPVITTGDYSAAMDCFSCDFTDTNGGISHDFDELRFFGGWWEPTPYRTIGNRAFHPQTHKYSQFNASITGGVMTVSAFTLGFPIGPGDNVVGAGVARGTFVTSYGTGTGGTGTYNVSVSQSVSSEAMYTIYYNQSDVAYGVTTVTGVSDGVTRATGLRWWDIYGTLSIHGMRGGGEFGGIPLVYVQSDISASVTPQTHQGATISVDGGSQFCGAAPETVGCIVLNAGIPKSISWHGTAGPDGQPIVKDNISGGFAADVSSFLTAASLTDAVPFIRYEIEPGGARGLSWPPAGDMWPTAVDPYITTFPHMGTFTVSDGSGAGLSFTTSDLNYQYNFNSCTIRFLIIWPTTANASIAQVNTNLPAGCKAPTVGNPVIDMPIVGGGTTTALRMLSNSVNMQFVNSTNNNQLSNVNLSGQIVLGTVTFPTTIQ